MDLAQFAKEIDRFSIELEKNVVDTMGEVVLGVAQELIARTPVDEGPARSNWRTSIGEPLEGTISAYSPGSHLGVGERDNAAGAYAQCQGVIETLKDVSRPIYIVNNLVYIGTLNEGHSKQAPANFVDHGIAAGVRILETVKILENF